MNSSPVQANIGSEKTGGKTWPWVIAGLVICFVAISSQSFWIDEAFMASKASQPTLADWWHMMPRGNGSDLQMPFYMFYMWGFAKVFGLSEWVLRAANIPWFVAGVAAFIPVFPKSQRLAAAVVTLLCPFAWFYLNEARPYAMQLGASLVIFAAIYRLSGDAMLPSRQERNWIAAFWLGIIVLCGSSLLGVIWSGAAFLSLVFLFPAKRLRQLLRTHWLTCLLSFVLLVGLAGYYIWTIKFGARALEAGNQPGGNAALTAVKSAAHFRQGFAGGSKLENFAFVIYELLGFSGLGPGKLEIRTERLAAFRHFAPALALFGIALMQLLLLAVRCIVRAQGAKKALVLFLITLSPMGLLMVAGHFLGFLTLGRHCTPLMPALLFVQSLGLAFVWSRNNAILKRITAVFLFLCLCSCLSLRFAARHEKDDYRDAARAANTALERGQKVWWSAAEEGAEYYHLPLASSPEEKGRAMLVLNPTPETLLGLSIPDLVIASKPDLYDNQAALVKYVRNNPYTQIDAFPAFTVWRRNTSPIRQ